MKKLLLLTLLTLSTSLSAVSILIPWVATTEREDGTPLNNDLAGFNIYYGNSSGIYSSNVNIPDPLATSYTLPVSSGTYYYVITAYDTDSRESAYSSPEVSVIIEQAPQSK